MSYKDTSLWKGSLGKEDMIVEPLRESYLDARKNAEFLLDKIRKDFPNLTVHDITHVDSLWNVADTIIGEDYPINPLEGYILGIAFLIHDAALSYDAVGGKDKLRDTIEWKDAYADGPDDEDEEEFKKECDFAAIRALHAKYAEDILNKKFERDNTTTFYIIDNDEYRTQFGDMIGKIAASHHWSIDEVESKLENQVNPVAGLPSDWEINEQKLACILRCADAGHIDNGRAPFGIYNSLIVNGVSRNHWESQTRLGQVRENRKSPEQLLITSTRPFEKNNFAAWNVAYDAVRLFDEELKKSNELLKPAGLSFPHRGVTGAESKEALSEYIKTNGWQPCNFGVHTSNVKALIENLGGSKLYGEENVLFIALRELIQNARDAIQARRTLDGRPEEGRITIRLKEEEGKRWIEVEDDGIGMSLDCIKNHLLDFGSSYWKSRLAKDENPGLRSKGFKSIGKFGIGFYSVFMVAKTVEVITRRYKDGEDAKKIEFPEGLTLSPVLSKDKLNTRISTLVRFELKDDVSINLFAISLQKALSLIVAGLDVDVFYEEGGSEVRVHQNITSPAFDKKDWLRQLFVDRFPMDFNAVANRLEFLKDDDENVMGLLAVADEDYLSSSYDNNHFTVMTPSIETVGGLATSFNSIWVQKGFIGFIDGRENNVSRNDIILDGKTARYFKKWIIERYDADYHKMMEPEKSLLRCYYSAFSYCGIDLNEILEGNIRKLYVTHKQKGIKIGTIKGLKRIHLLLFSGASTNAGQFNIVDMHYYQSFDGVMRYIEEMPEDSCSDIICKFLKMMVVKPFIDGNESAGRVWVNIMLDRFMSEMIDWGNVEIVILYKKVFSTPSAYELEQQMTPRVFEGERFELFKEERFEDACRYLEQFLIPSNIYMAKMTTQTNKII